ncbi:uncharacterized protein KRP23_636 [Phytophthora ramorum]|uniref:uncharacterized protein n=1 Tax=Phytophthora ramorum TaxID=164328 RepID=UPI0030B25CDD|nr:hypothetical protein KRP23_636 [Phytophthora ramorum]KAH7503410.1 hypothetical protein KRP22_6462 [Phytophthora ramorum]
MHAGTIISSRSSLRRQLLLVRSAAVDHRKVDYLSKLLIFLVLWLAVLVARLVHQFAAVLLAVLDLLLEIVGSTFQLRLLLLAGRHFARQHHAWLLHLVHAGTPLLRVTAAQHHKKKDCQQRDAEERHVTGANAVRG